MVRWRDREIKECLRGGSRGNGSEGEREKRKKEKKIEFEWLCSVERKRKRGEGEERERKEKERGLFAGEKEGVSGEHVHVWEGVRER